MIVNTRGTSTPITFINDLGTVNTGNATTDTKVEFYKYSIDQTLAWADPLNNEANQCAKNWAGYSGAFRPDPARRTTAARSQPLSICTAATFRRNLTAARTPGSPATDAYKGHGYYSFAGAPANGAIYKYPNRQEAAPIWFHDHLLGGTRLNVHAGLAGAYYIADPALTPAYRPVCSRLTRSHPARDPGPHVRHQRTALLPG